MVFRSVNKTNAKRSLTILQPPIIPHITFDGDTQNFENYPEQISWRRKRLPEKDLKLFADF